MKIHFRSLGKVVEYEGIGYQAGQQVTLTEGEAWALNKALADAIRQAVTGAELDPESPEAAALAAETRIAGPQRAAAAPKKTPLDIYVEETLALQIMWQVPSPCCCLRVAQPQRRCGCVA